MSLTQHLIRGAKEVSVIALGIYAGYLLVSWASKGSAASASGTTPQTFA